MKKRSTKKPLDPRVQIAIAVAAPLLMLVIGWMIAVKPQKAKATKVVDEIAAVQLQVEQAQVAARQAEKPEPIRAADIFRLATAMPRGAGERDPVHVDHFVPDGPAGRRLPDDEDRPVVLGELLRALGLPLPAA
jgi:hypothetical protein